MDRGKWQDATVSSDMDQPCFWRFCQGQNEHCTKCSKNRITLHPDLCCPVSALCCHILSLNCRGPWCCCQDWTCKVGKIYIHTRVSRITKESHSFGVLVDSSWYVVTRLWSRTRQTASSPHRWISQERILYNVFSCVLGVLYSVWNRITVRLPEGRVNQSSRTSYWSMIQKVLMQDLRVRLWCYSRLYKWRLRMTWGST